MKRLNKAVLALATAGVLSSGAPFMSSVSYAADFGVTDYVRSESKNVDWLPAYHEVVCGSVKAGVASSSCAASTAYAQTSSTISLGSVSGSAYAFAGPTPGWGGTASAVDSYWWDTITITSASLATGTVVTVKGQIDMTASVVPSWPYPVPATRAQAQLNYIGPDCCNFVTVRSDQDYPTTGSFLAHVGSSYKIFGKYYIHTGTFAHNDFADLGSVDASARYFLWVDTPGAGYASASGMNYAPVPEPSSLAMLLVGMATVAATRLRRRITS